MGGLSGVYVYLHAHVDLFAGVQPCTGSRLMLCCVVLVCVVLCLQEDAQELADPVRLARLIKQYSQFIQFPIKLWSARKEAKQVGGGHRAGVCWETQAVLQGRWWRMLCEFGLVTWSSTCS